MYNNKLNTGRSNPATPKNLPSVIQYGPIEPIWLRWIRGKTWLPATANTTPAGSESYRNAALRWHQFGFQVVPVVAETKRPACKWDPWLEALTPATIVQHWNRYPDHEVGIIAGSDLIVFDADTPEAMAAFNQLMASLDVACNHIVATTKGEHYYFRLAADVVAKSDSHSTSEYPTRLDVKTGRALVVAPPSTGKQMLLSEAENTDDLVEVGQDFVDAVFRHNGRDAPRRPEPKAEAKVVTDPPEGVLAEIAVLLEHLDPSCGYDEWRTVLMAAHHESNGGRDGLEVVDTWSSGGTNYPGPGEVERKWHTFDDFDGDALTIGSIRKLVSDTGTNPADICVEQFDPIEEDEPEVHPWVKHSLCGLSSQFDAEMQAQEAILGDWAIRGQWTVLYAPPNAGKTAITFSEVIASIKSGVIDPKKLFYVNADDNHHGLTSKLKLAEKHGFHMLAPSYQGFQTEDFLDNLRELSASGQAMGMIMILDTTKKFTDLMDKRRASEFGKGVREFISKGGTMICLAHVNKNRGQDGKLVFAGTTDIRDDADCCYVIDTVSDANDIRTVEFENEKSRGIVPKQTVYQYSTVTGQSYRDLLDSVTHVDDAQAEALRASIKQAADPNQPIVKAITDAIQGGITAKTKLVEAAADSTGQSKRQVQKVLEQYTGDNIFEHSWKMSIGGRGVNNYELLLDPDNGDADVEDLQN